MDNSTSMARSDADYILLASADLVISLLRPGDRIHLVSAGAKASIVLSGTGEDREMFRAALTRLHREASASDSLSVLELLVDHFEKNKNKSMMPLVFWFSGKHFSYDVSNPDYYDTDVLKEGFEKARESKSFERDPFKVKAFKDIQPQLVERIGTLLEEQTDDLDDLGVVLNLFVSGKQYSSPGSTDQSVTEMMNKVAASGKFITNDGDGEMLLSQVLSVYTTSVNAPSQTVDPSGMGRKGESFEVLRGCRHMWIVLLFSRTPEDLGFSAEDVASEVVKSWPFGKPEGEYYSVEPHVEKGLEYKQKRWYRLPESPVGYALYSVMDPLPGNYRIRVQFEKGVTYLLRIMQDVDLEYGFLDNPPDSIPLGMNISSVSALKHPEGYTYVFNRGFVDDLVFKVLMRKIDGSLPEWGSVQILDPSREGETSFSFSPEDPGTYFLKGKVVSRSGEFVAFMKPHRIDVYPRIPLRFDTSPMTWKSDGGEGWTQIEPALRIADGVELPPDIEFIIHIDASSVTGSNNIELDPGQSFTVSRDNPEVVFRVRYPDAEKFRLRGGKFDGTLRLSVDPTQEQIVEGSGVWEIPVHGRIASWGMGRFHTEYGLLINLLLIFVVVALFVTERIRRPAFGKGILFESVNVIGGRERRHGVDAGARFKPIVPFVRQKIIVGRGGDVGLYREEVLCVIVPTRVGFDICPRASKIMYDDDDGVVVSMEQPFAGVVGRRYRVGGDDGKLEFWFERRSADSAGQGG